MEERSEKAVALMKDGYNCAQAVACVFAEEAGADKATVFRIAEGFGSGMGTMQHYPSCEGRQNWYVDQSPL
uniref:C-GCAxxG-C-C family protein n=1 Tax=uncultured Selenomonas sp. TaxID=159275 RepID=UPI00258B655A